MFKDAKVGDRVWSVTCGWGTIDYGKWSATYPLHVQFDIHRAKIYTLDGYSDLSDTGPSLFWDEVKITPPPRPKRMKKVNKTGWINIFADLNGRHYTGEVHNTEGAADEVGGGSVCDAMLIEWQEEEEVIP